MNIVVSRFFVARSYCAGSHKRLFLFTLVRAIKTWPLTTLYNVSTTIVLQYEIKLDPLLDAEVL